ncbi:MAG TPA: substrate import-associated zinc metallohydrolase lipoprotein [Chitinophagaceae bacterium]|nr:substrate import-associated zinc metallohydrolase lipoprotein [Chitinophagaceae bacterium]
MKNKIIFRITAVLLMCAVLQACNKESFTPIDMSELNPDVAKKNTPLDQWLQKNFLDPYNSEVIYRNHMYYHESDRNVSPPNVDAVKPMMTSVLEGFVKPYDDVAGVDFMKKNMPRQWVLYGSTSYDGSGVGYAGTASGGVRINLFGINSFSLSPGFIKGRLGVIHHEFTHILNQRFIMPADFQEITKSTYNGNWTDVATEDAHNWGYVSAYASQNPTEDFAETTKALLVSGQSWFDAWVLSSGSAEGQTALRAKEQSVVSYFNSSLNIDFRKLQKEVQTYIKDVVKDPSVNFKYWLNAGLYKTITINLGDEIYTQFPVSQEFIDGFNAMKQAVADFNSVYTMNYIEFRFESSTSLVVRAQFTNTDGDAYYSDYSFSYTLDASTGEIHFTKVAQASGTTFDNGNLFINTFKNTIQKYLEENTFIAKWMPKDAPASMYTHVAGFYEQNTPENKIYGTTGEQL